MACEDAMPSGAACTAGGMPSAALRTAAENSVLNV